MTDYLEPVDVEDLIASMGFHLRDRNLLLSALAAPLPVFGEADGNKRLSWIVAKAFLALNGEHLAADSVREGDEFIRAVAGNQIKLDEAVGWIEAHSTRL